MDAFKTSPIVQDIRWSCGFKSSLIYYNVIDHGSDEIAVTINKNGIFGVWKVGKNIDETIYDLEPQELNDDTLKEIATVPGAAEKIGDALTKEIKNYYNEKNKD